MQVKEILKTLEQDSEFKVWKNKNKQSHLAHIFKIIDDTNKDIWQIGYYNPDGTVTTFIINNKEIQILPNQEIFQKEKKKVKELEIDKIQFDLDEALEIASDFQKEQYKGNDPAKTMAILQNIANNLIYNISYITITFNTLNIKIDAINKKIISHEITPMMQFKGKAS
jgi:hypothetical protein